MAQFFRGNLAGLMIRSGKLENKKVIDCLYTCKEGLDVQLPEEVASAVKVRRATADQWEFWCCQHCFRRPNFITVPPPFRWSSTPVSPL